MRRQTSGRVQSDYRSYGYQGDGNSSDGPTYLNSSGGSSNQDGPTRPVIRPSNRVSHLKTPELPRVTPSGAESPMASETRTSERPTFSLNGQQIKETYKPRLRAATSSPRPSTPVSRAFRTNSPGQRANTQNTSNRPLTRNTRGHWALQQELKVKILGITKKQWTKDVYFAVSNYGNVTRIDMEAGSRDNNAWVVFQPPPKKLPPQLCIGRKHEVRHPTLFTVPSPVNSAIQYQENNILYANYISFGIQTEKKSLVNMHEVHAAGEVQIKLNLRRKEVEVQFPLTIDKQKHTCSFQLPISQLSGIHKTEDGRRSSSIIIPFDRPPQFFVQKKPTTKDDSMFPTKERSWSVWSTMFRETDVIDGRTRGCMQTLPLSDGRGSAIIDIGRWTTYQLCFDSSTLSGAQFEEFRNALGDFGVALKDCDQFDISSERPSPLATMLEEEYTGTLSSLQALQTTSSIFDDLAFGLVHLNFPVRYQLESCLSNGFIKESNITRKFLEDLRALDPSHATHILEKVVRKQRVYYDPMDIFKTRTKLTPQRLIPKHCVMQRSVNITPTMMHVASPVMEISNRITRQYLADSDRFIRVKFTDEKGEGALRNMSGGRHDALFNRVSRAMKNGIVVAGRYYEFLAFGNSQFREAGAYFYSPTSTKSAHDIRVTLGDFSDIKSVAKYGARIGQCFSTTRAMQTTVAVHAIDDIERNGYTFTDGVGKLSLFLAQMAAQDLGLQNPFDDPPSLYQFRLGGCKGVLALDPAIKKTEVHIRPSQFKFKAPYNGLEIIRCSSLATPFFNRQVIIVLSDLGVPDHIFIRKQQQMINACELAMMDKTEALKCLLNHIDMNQTTLTMASMVLDGFLDTQEPFMMSLLHLWRASTIKELKKKARIVIDNGAFVLGCIDESGILQGHRDEPQSRHDATRDEKLRTLPEIFIQVDDTSRKCHYKVIKGVCILARNPSLHPGDIRIVRAVDVPALHHHKNVVVLPQTGDRDLANMCSGGDLDGDDYMVLWDKDLLPKLINNGPIDIRAVGDFFVTYMKNDSLGKIAHAHLAQADQQSGGVTSDICIELAKLHSQAVDYPKSGIPAVMDHALRPKKWPHFMEKRHLTAAQIYQSKNILGMLYDQVQLVDFLPMWEDKFDQRILDAFDLDEALLDMVANIKSKYDNDLKRLMAKHGIQTEFEAFSVFVLEHNEETRDYKFAEEFGQIIRVLKLQYKEMCIHASGASTIVDWGQIGPFVAAMYTVSAQQTRDALKECNMTKTVGGQQVPVRNKDAESMPLMSFPWIFHSELGKLATGNKAMQLDVVHEQRRRKHRANKPGATDELGTAETNQGITRIGEMLNLDFGDPQAMAASEQQHEIGVQSGVEVAESSKERRGSLPVASPSVLEP
ncbi:RdRP-domain-containing protein [Didymella exigua CBS 183.55]|uniref:RNA-dependent RNA polymerase n=1 Tax=Didymella exigua CBS 183.55 TaxID=1150837 RepID=A0A6A5S700_9PLEO|nr:RdRP-domain-containing protein [Didymella exigua CBS 183.55]KAF1934276.1 RdRP-domain-containing protein [Didymella exigua CBS 183.55]